MKKATSILLTVLMVLALIPTITLAAPPSTGDLVNGQWKMTVENIDLLTLSVMPDVERKVLIDADGIWPKTEKEKEEFTVPVGTIVTYQAGPSPMNMAGLFVSKLFFVRIEDGLDFYSEYSEIDEEGDPYGSDENIYVYNLKDETDDWPPSDDVKKTSFTFTEEGLYGVKAVYIDNNENFPTSYYLVINVVGNPTVPVDKPSSWAELQVGAAIDEKLVPQSLQSKYTQTTTRAEFCALAVCLYETVKGTISERKTFVDTADVNVEKMGALGVVAGVGDDRFDPNGTLTREQAATMLSRLASVIGKPLPEQAATFADNADISSWALTQVGQVQAAGIMSGVGNNTFAPKGSYTREQSIVTMLRLYEFIK